jgi:hypothetical protein
MSWSLLMFGVRLFAILGLGALLSGCGVVAAPCRVGSAVLDMVPLVGHVAAAPTDACAGVIDPG